MFIEREEREMKHCLIACLLACSTFAFAQDRAPVIRFDSAPDPLKLPNDIYFGEVTGVAVNSQGHVFRALARQHDGSRLRGSRDAAPRVRPQRQVLARDRTQSLRMVVRPFGSRGSAGQHLGDRQGVGHGHQVQSAGTRDDGVRPQAGGFRRGHGPAQASEAAASSGDWTFSSGDRCHLGPGG
jgi:hypothetical protein